MTDKSQEESHLKTNTDDTTFFLPRIARLLESTNEPVAGNNYVGRYKLPVSMHDRLLDQLKKRIFELVGQNTADSSVVLATPSYPIPPGWRKITEYLHRAGILQHPRFTFDRIFNDEPKIYALRLWAAPSPTDGGTMISNGGYSRGVSHDFEEAMSKVIGEVLERYPQTLYRNKDLIRASVASMRKKKAVFLDPFIADHWSPWQKKRFPSRNFDENSIFSFVKGKSLMRKGNAYIPAQMAYLNYRFAENEPMLRHPNSNGAGGMFSYEEAILSGLYELIQRDAFLTKWLAGITPRRIDLSTLKNPDTQRLLKDFARYHLDVHVVETTSDLDVPAFVAVVIDNSGVGPAVTLGGGCGFDQEKAILRALTESIGVRNWLRLRRKDHPGDLLPSVKGREAFTEDWGSNKRLLLWYGTENINEINFFLGGVHTPIDYSKDRLFKMPDEELAYLIDLFRSRGDEYEIFVYEAQHEALNVLGYHSVKVCVPALLPLYLMETYAPLGSKRLADAQKEAGKEGIPATPYPHPFP
ncbi:hypothetical protein C4568_02700 [Candidatus Parcubacteria bacterium]|nr:MAG: hypothetical protein C4568_02700 [Candidatus Parcubacteria bacterium]